MVNAILIHENDSVVISITEIAKGKTVTYKTADGQAISFEVLDTIPPYHKIALKDIKKGEEILKYGEYIGIASQDIKKGNHVHEHNVESVRREIHD